MRLNDFVDKIMQFTDYDCDQDDKEVELIFL